MVQRLGFYVSLVLGLAALGGCSGGGDDPVTPPTNNAPVANSPSNALRRFEYANDNRDGTIYNGLFTSDFEFEFVPGDSAGIPYAVTHWNRTDELAYFDHLIHGGNASQPAATGVQLALAGTFTENNDPRPGKNPGWHKTIRSSVVFIVNFSDGSTADITGDCDFYFTKGDSAAGVTPDPTLWYIDHWTDDTLPDPGPSPFSILPARASDDPTPTQNNSWGRLKTQYR